MTYTVYIVVCLFARIEQVRVRLLEYATGVRIDYWGCASCFSLMYLLMLHVITFSQRQRGSQ